MDLIKQDGYRIKAFYATIWSDAGRAIFGNFNMKIIAKDDLSHEIIRVTPQEILGF